MAFYNLFFNFVSMNEVKAWLKRKNETDEVLRIIRRPEGKASAFVLLRAYDMGAPALGKILFDENGYWIYDGDELLVEEQEQMATFIVKNYFKDDDHAV